MFWVKFFPLSMNEPWNVIYFPEVLQVSVSFGGKEVDKQQVSQWIDDTLQVA